MRKVIILILAACLLCLGCASTEDSEEKVRDLTYTIVREEDIPPQLLTIINEKKSQNFKLTYEDDEKRYIAVGYGQQASGGYSIQVKELSLGKNAVYFDTELIGPKKNDIDSREKSYPYIVVETSQSEKPVVFK